MLLLFVLTCLPQGEIELKEAEIEDTKDKIATIEQHELTSSQRLDKILRRIDRVKSDMKETQNRLLEIRDAIVRLNVLKEQQQLRLEETLEKKKAIVNNIYMSKGLSEPLTITAISDMEELNSKKVYLTSIAEYRDQIFIREQAQRDSIATLVEETVDKENQEKEKIRLNLVLADSLRDLEKTSREAIDRLHGEKEEYIAALKVMEEQLEELRQLGMAEQNIPGTFPQQLPWPVQSREILHGFGLTKDSRYDTEFYNPGIDIKAQPNENVLSVYSGLVTHIGWVRGFGNIVVVKHPDDYYTLYGNLDNLYVTKGMEVKQDDMIGQVSPNGWLEGSKLHFEIRKGRDEINPLFRLKR